jgi:hypothetical protein
MRNRKIVRWVVGCAVTGVLVAGIAIGGTALAGDKSDKAPTPEREAPAVEQVEAPQANTLSEHEWT